MRLATLPDGPDGRLVVVEDGSARAIACRTMLAWLDGGDAALGPEEDWQPEQAMACLPRAWQFLDGSAYVNHVALVRQARGAEMPERFWHDPLMYQGLNLFTGPRDPIPSAPDWGTDLEAEVAVLTGPVPRGATPDEAARAIRAICLLNDISLRGLIPDELGKGFGFVHSKPASALSPLAVTPDALPYDGRLHATVHVEVNGTKLGETRAGEDMTFDFPTLVAHAAKTRDLPAGTVIGSGTVSNRDPDGGPGRPVDAGGRGYSCLAEQRMVETILDGQARSPWLRPGDRVRIWAEADGHDLFGVIEQEVIEWHKLD
ncbi:fumarylacetoacetate hydrolase family protein [Jannaschia aquimarina]|uniref:Fumarylacetoacetate (FAA) hydrolase family protein n=1 Tax=Jannaschia aquimarina TaxID=935700 RepID=A0A0D1ECD0_9RHOB|nr:fumarylacetoacetate hydrolase family protein [Jannaschia aquimarina]KIT15369.1 Fumarylacetoacetate (FAA) hydrolase family protein [Jannaschia aquimarina]SNT23314.1 fumarylacetoacetate (FAA) hydrolase [Jannaschia aquimarina]